MSDTISKEKVKYDKKCRREELYTEKLLTNRIIFSDNMFLCWLLIIIIITDYSKKKNSQTKAELHETLWKAGT